MTAADHSLMEDSSMELGFIGLGRMGSLMAPLLARAGFAVRSYDRNGSGTHASPRALKRVCVAWSAASSAPNSCSIAV